MTANGVGDVTLAGGLLSSPVWASWLAEFNELLTSVTLIIGILIGVVRLWVAWREHNRHARGRGNPPDEGSMTRPPCGEGH
jgi:hypothetical protein